jgi:hypothetical protein
MALRTTQPLTEMSTRNIPGGEGRPARKADNLTAICEPIVYKMWEPQYLTTLWVSTARYRDTFTLPYIYNLELWIYCFFRIFFNYFRLQPWELNDMFYFDIEAFLSLFSHCKNMGLTCIWTYAVRA